MKSGKLFLSFITSKVFELQGCATAQIVDCFKSFQNSIYFLIFDDSNGRYDLEKKGVSLLMSKIVDLILCQKMMSFGQTKE